MFFHLTPLSETRTLFLRLVSLCYAMAFLSIYPQIEGLYGPRGLLPASHTLKSLPGLSSDVGWSNIQEWLRHWHPNLLKILPSYLGIRVDLTMELLCLLGATLAMAMTIKRSFNHKLNFVLLWLFYISIYSVGQTFLWFQWDILLVSTIDPLGRPTVTAKSDHYFHTYRPSVLTFQKLSKQNKLHMNIMFTTGATVVLAEGIIDSTCLVLFITNE